MSKGSAGAWGSSYRLNHAAELAILVVLTLGSSHFNNVSGNVVKSKG